MSHRDEPDQTPEQPADTEPATIEDSARESAETPVDDAADTKEPAEREWWDDPRMPWSGKPSKSDKLCWAAFMLLGVYGLVMLPLRPVILGMSTYALAVISGSTVAMVDIGAGLRLGGEPHWWFWLAVAALSVMKFDWIFWWAGRLWGHGMIDLLAGRSRWAARTAKHAERLAERFGIAAIFLVWLVPFLPNAVVVAFVGMTKMRLRTFLSVYYLGALTNRAIYFYLGYRLGEPAKDAIDVIQKYSLYISIAIVLIVIVNSVRSSRKESSDAPSS